MLMFATDGTREAVPTAINEVAFGRGFEFVFTIQYFKEQGCYILFASLYCTFKV